MTKEKPRRMKPDPAAVPDKDPLQQVPGVWQQIESIRTSRSFAGASESTRLALSIRHLREAATPKGHRTNLFARMPEGDYVELANTLGLILERLVKPSEFNKRSFLEVMNVVQTNFTSSKKGT